MSLTAVSMRSATGQGWEASEAWLASSSTVLRGLILSAMRRSLSGLIMRSFADTWYQVGLVRHASPDARSWVRAPRWAGAELLEAARQRVGGLVRGSLDR